ncbi:MAG: hypothetical protein ACFE9S_04675 [Candidatus Hermodarchaeota archaeon]
MRKIVKQVYLIPFFLILTFMFLNITSFMKISHAQINNDSLNPHANFIFIEFSEQIGNNSDISSLDIPLASESWNITNIEMNFTDIRLGKEIKAIEDLSDGSSKITIGNAIKGWGVQVNITEPTTIFGAYIMGYRSIQTPTISVYFQLTGYDNVTDTPNSNIIRSTILNISTIPNWYLQTFQNEIDLSPGQYYLTLNGSQLLPYEKTAYYWNYNDSSSINPTLHTSKYDGSKWVQEAVGEPLLYKLIQRVNRTYSPEDINMTLNIDGSLYPVNANGSFTLDTIISPNTDLFHIPITNNRSITPLFNLDFHIKLRNWLNTTGDVLIQEDLANTWTIEPEIQRCFCTYSFKFNYPSGWYNLRVFRDIGGGWVDITSIVIVNTTNYFILISNITILDGSDWRITANSPNIPLSLNVPTTGFGPGQEIQFSVNAPINPGNLTFRLVNPLGFLAQPDVIYILDTIETEDLLLSYQLSNNPYAGTYKTYVFWNNGIAAGVISQEFVITIPFTLDPIVIAMIAGAIAFVALFSFTTYKVAKNSKLKHEAHRQKIFNKYMDVLNLDYFIIIHKQSGLNVYEQVLATKSIDASLITGFLEAIRTFGIELTGAGEQSQTIKLEYHKSKILMSEFKSFRILLIMKESPSQDFLDSIKTLSYDIDNKYGSQIEKFKGNLDAFIGIRDLLEQHLQTSLIYPLKIVKQQVKLKSDEKSMMNKAKNIMKKKNTDYFTVTNLLSIRKGFYTKEAETILNLIQKKVFQPKM